MRMLQPAKTLLWDHDALWSGRQLACVGSVPICSLDLYMWFRMMRVVTLDHHVYVLTSRMIAGYRAQPLAVQLCRAMGVLHNAAMVGHQTDTSRSLVGRLLRSIFVAKKRSASIFAMPCLTCYQVNLHELYYVIRQHSSNLRLQVVHLLRPNLRHSTAPISCAAQARSEQP